MKILARFLLLLSLNAFSKVSLFPEDGSQKIGKWFYSEDEIQYMYKPGEWEEVIRSFKKVGIEPINTQIGSFFQDLAFFDKQGDLVLQHLPKKLTHDSYSFERYFQGFTMEIFMPAEYPGGKPSINFLSGSDAKKLGLKTKSLKNVFFEGGASISGKFANGNDYFITNSANFYGVYNYLKDYLKKPNLSKQEAKKIIEEQLTLKENHYIVLEGTGHLHIDTFIKALPNGVLLVDDPERRIDVIKDLIQKFPSKKLLDYLKYEQSPNYSSKREHYITRVSKAKNILLKYFDVFPVVGTFVEEVSYDNGLKLPKMNVNFFNGVSGAFFSHQFYITNKAQGASVLEDYWELVLEEFGFRNEFVMFPGVYLGNAGLDCMGSLSP